ncbi:NERD domain-containing protein [Lentibacillus cibarius]|uniref:NERD domain-containing protein n=1 Tax=Lentibacillus cibarius TaxID=2583219 RepID=A0A549YII1_9BACI|nr:NERD domain-containing protein [Lentibacillus cibarius]
MLRLCSALIVKPRDYPLEVLKTEALNRRLVAHHSRKKEVKRKAKNLRAGYNGEKSLDFHLGFLQDESYRILHHLRIRDANEFFQMDTTIISPQFILINDAKNISGTVIYDEFGQAIRISKSGEEENLGNHIEQVNLQHLRLLRWMRNHDFPAIPIEKLVTHSNSNTIIKNITNNKAVSDTIIYKEQLLTKIEEFADKHNAPVFTEEQLQHLAALLIDAHTPKEVDLLNKFGMKCEEILRGVFCPECSALPMKRTKAKWICRQCGETSKDAHIPALQDYCLLFGNKIRNREARKFLMVDDIYVTQRLLKKEQLETVGTTRDRQYILRF